MDPYLYYWFILIAVMITVYIVVGGTHLGYGLWYLFAPHGERDCYLNAANPHIIGSELWIIMAGSALYLLFPSVYKIVVVGFYPVIMLLVIIMFFRFIVTMLRNVSSRILWQSFWDVSISLSALIPMFLKGLIVGYILKGIPLYNVGRFNVNMLGYLNHYTIATGFLLVFANATMSCSVIAGNSDGIAQINARKWAFYSSLIVCFIFSDLSIWSLVVSPYISENITNNPYFFTVPGIVFIATVSLPFLIGKRRYLAAYVVSVLVVLGFSSIFFISIYPHLKIIFFANEASELYTLLDNQDTSSIASALGKKLLFVYIGLIALTVVIQIYIFRYYRQRVHCPIPYDKEDDNLF